jgi:hypothetical protein
MDESYTSEDVTALRAAARILTQEIDGFNEAPDWFEDFFTAIGIVDKLAQHRLPPHRRAWIVCSAIYGHYIARADVSETHPFSEGGYNLYSLMSAAAFHVVRSKEDEPDSLDEDNLNYWRG